MKKLVLNDSRQIDIQAISASGGVMHVRMILTTADQLKALFADTFATSKMTAFENGKTIGTYENYTKFNYVKEETGGIFEVEMVQPEADTGTRLAEVEEKTTENATNMEMAIAEITMLIAALLSPTVEEVAENV